MAGIAAGTMQAPAGAQDFPTKPITIVVPFGPGTTNDIIARQLAQDMTGTLGQSVIVENRAGATGNIATDFVAKSRPDGYTLLIASMSNILNQVTGNTSSDLAKDFAPVGFAGKTPYSMLVPNELPAKTVAVKAGALGAAPAKRGGDGKLEVMFRPDPTIFPKVEFDAAVIRARLEVASYLHHGVRVTFEDEGHRQKDVEEGQTFAKKLGKEVLPTFLSVVDDPSQERFKEIDLNGYFRYDDECVPAQPASRVRAKMARAKVSGDWKWSTSSPSGRTISISTTMLTTPPIVPQTSETPSALAAFPCRVSS